MLGLIATASVAPASDAHLILLLRARQAIITWRAGEEADRQVAPDIDAALEQLGFEARSTSTTLKRGWSRPGRSPDGRVATRRSTGHPAITSTRSRPSRTPQAGQSRRAGRCWPG